jgi:hypothetical protein
LAILSFPEFAQFVAARREQPVDFVRGATVVHFRMNVLSDIWLAERDGIVPDGMRYFQFSDWVRFLNKIYPEELRHILEEDTLVGHDPRYLAAFIDALPGEGDPRIAEGEKTFTAEQKRELKRRHGAGE